MRLSDDVVVGVFPSLHSCVWSQTAMTGSDAVCIGDLGLDAPGARGAHGRRSAQHFVSLGDDVLAHLHVSNQGAKGDGGALVYVFETPDGSILYQDTSGHWSGILHDLRPDVAILAAAGRGNVDGEPMQGTLAQFVARQAWLVKARDVDPVPSRRLAARASRPPPTSRRSATRSRSGSRARAHRARLPRRPPASRKDHPMILVVLKAPMRAKYADDFPSFI